MINSVRPFRCGYTYRLRSKNVHTYLYISILAFTHILFLSLYILLKSLLMWHCPGSPVVKTPHSTVWGLGSIPGGKLRPCMPLVGPKKKKIWLQNEKGTRLCANLACSSFSINSFIFRLTCLVKLGETRWMKCDCTSVCLWDAHMHLSVTLFLTFHSVRMQLYRFSRRDDTVKCKTCRGHWFRGLTFDSTKFVFSLQSFH